MIADFPKPNTKTTARGASSLRLPSLSTALGVSAMASGAAMIGIVTAPRVGVAATVVAAQASWFFTSFEAFSQRNRPKRSLRVAAYAGIAVLVAIANWGLTRQGARPGVRVGLSLAALAVGAFAAARAVMVTNHLARQTALVKARMSPDRVIDLVAGHETEVQRIEAKQIESQQSEALVLDLSGTAAAAPSEVTVLDLSSEAADVQSEVTVGDLTIIGSSAAATENEDIIRHNEKVLS